MSSFKFHLSAFLVLVCLILLGSDSFLFAQSTSHGTTKNSPKATDNLNTQNIDTNSVLHMANRAYFYVYRDTGKAFNYAQSAIKWSHKLHFQAGLGKSYRIMGIIQEQLDHYQKAIIYFDKSLKVYQNLNDIHGIGMVYMDKGILYRSLYNAAKALSFELNALEQFQQINDSLRIVSANINIGTIYNKEGKHKQALDSFKKAVRYSKNHHKLNILSAVYENLGVTYEDLKNYPEALKYYHKSIDIQKKLGNRQTLSYNYQNIGDIYNNMKQPKKALKYLFKADKINHQIGGKGIISNTYSSIGQVYLSENKPHKALKYANLAIKLANESGTLIYKDYGEQLKSVIYDSLHDYKKAYQYQNKYYSISDTLNKQEEKRKFSELSLEYKTKQKEQKIKLLKKEDDLEKARLKKGSLYQRSLIIFSILLLIIILLLANGYRLKKKSESVLQNKNRELEEANDQISKNEQLVKKQSRELQSKNEELEKINQRLQDMDESKNDFFQIAAHDMKNPLIGISGLIEIMLSSDIQSLPEAKESVREKLKMINKTSNDMISLIERLLTVNQIDTNSFNVNLGTFPVSDIITQVIDNQTHAADLKRIDIKQSIQSFDDKAQIDKNAFRQIMENLISNAIKYSYRDSTVVVEEEKSNDQIIIRVIDDGPGIPKEEQKNLFQKFSRLSTKPTNGESSNGLGLYIVKKYVDAMKGEIQYEGSQGAGSSFIVSLPAFNKNEE